jgi:hypothetical protein
MGVFEQAEILVPEVTIQKALSQCHDKLQMQLSSMGISRGSTSVSLGQLKDLLEEHHFSIGSARR